MNSLSRSSVVGSLLMPKLTTEGQKVLKLLEAKYGMTRENALKLMQDGGAPLAMALIPAARGTL